MIDERAVLSRHRDLDARPLAQHSKLDGLTKCKFNLGFLSGCAVAVDLWGIPISRHSGMRAAGISRTVSADVEVAGTVLVLHG